MNKVHYIMNKIPKLLTIIIYIIVTIFMLLFFTNKSNISSEYIIPIIIILQVKYYFGDWNNKGFYDYKNIIYWICIAIGSYLSVILINKFYIIESLN